MGSLFIVLFVGLKILPQLRSQFVMMMIIVCLAHIVMDLAMICIMTSLSVIIVTGQVHIALIIKGVVMCDHPCKDWFDGVADCRTCKYNDDDFYEYDVDFDDDDGCEDLDSDICPYCGEPMIDDLEVGQGYHVTAPCWMYANGMIEEAQAWEREHGELIEMARGL